MSHPNHAIARAFFGALSAGDIPDSLVTPDMTAWTTSGGTSPRERFQMGIRMFASVFDGGIAYAIDSLTAEDDRVAAEVHARGTLTNGEVYEGVYMFMLRIRDGRVATFAEHNNPVRVQATIMPLLREKIAAMTGG